MNEGKSNEEIWNEYSEIFDNDNFLIKFRDYIVVNNLGYGENEFCVFWDKLISRFKKDFSFLEIGVYKGQVLCLIGLLAKKYNLNAKINGIAPLFNLNDSTTSYDDSDYIADIVNLHRHFSVDFSLEKQIIKGSSTDQEIKKQIINLPKFDIIYIDGGHEYATVVSDINLSKNICKNNGFLILDDSSWFIEFDNNKFKKDFYKVNSIFKGHEEVSLAVKNFLETDPDYVEKYCIGHLRVFQKNENI